MESTEFNSNGLMTSAEIHDLKNLLSVIATSSELLLYQNLTGPADTIARGMTRSAECALDIVTQALSAESMDSTRTPHRIGDILADVIGIATPQLVAKRISVWTFVDDKGWSIQVDRLRLIRSLGNILDNAIKQSGGGHIQIVALIDEVQSETNRECVISIADAGEGFREDRDEFPERGGLGYRIGLTSVKSWLNSIGGELEAGNRADIRGANVRMKFPVSTLPDADIQEHEIVDLVILSDYSDARIATARSMRFYVLGVESDVQMASPESYFWRYVSRTPKKVLLVDIDSVVGAAYCEAARKARDQSPIPIVAFAKSFDDNRRYELASIGFSGCLRGESYTDAIAGLSTDFAASWFAAGSPKPATRAAKLPQSLQGKRILIVDDTDAWLSMCSSLANQAGAQASLASDGNEALHRLTTQPDGYYDVILMDYYLPFLNGAEILERYGKAGALKDHQTVVIASADTLSHEHLSIVKNMITAVVRKPVSVEDLMKIFSQTGDFGPRSRCGIKGLAHISPRRSALIGEQLKQKTLRELPATTLRLQQAVRKVDLDGVRAIAHQLRATLSLCGYGRLSEYLDKDGIPEKQPQLNSWLVGCLSMVDEILLEELFYRRKVTAAHTDSGLAMKRGKVKKIES
jgi:CheY-like chemotaxis protein